MLHIPATVANKTKTKPNGTSEACMNTDPAPRAAPIATEYK
jgi:hypothetical protein